MSFFFIHCLLNKGAAQDNLIFFSDSYQSVFFVFKEKGKCEEDPNNKAECNITE